MQINSHFFGYIPMLGFNTERFCMNPRCQHADKRLGTSTASVSATNAVFRHAKSDLLSSQQVRFRANGW
jgi:hypothetical protein